MSADYHRCRFMYKNWGSEKFPFLYDILPLIADKVFIHKIVYDEIRMPQSAKDQVDSLIREGKMKIVDDLQLSPIELSLYFATYKVLAEVMLNPSLPNKNKGEICSLSYAKVKSIPIFATDERDLQNIIDLRLNTGTNDIKCLRLIDLITLFQSGKISGISRKKAKVLWKISNKKIETFDKEIWPI